MFNKFSSIMLVTLLKKVMTENIVISSLLILIIGFTLSWLIQKYFCLFPYHFSDESDNRRKLKTRLGVNLPNDILHEEKWQPNERGMLLYHQIFLPKIDTVRGIIGICHGFADNTASFPTDLAIMFCKEGYGVIMQDCEGHGYSDGLHGHITDLHCTSQDIIHFFESQMSSDRFSSLPFFVYGESMGGANAFLISISEKKLLKINGVILLAPMIKISDDLRPNKFLEFILTFLVQYIPLAQLIPVKNLDSLCFKRTKSYLKAKHNPLGYKKWLRLETGICFKNITEEITNSLEKFKDPVFILHGDDDKITCPLHSEEFYNKCKSKDKMIKIYKNCWHSLLFGEHESISNDIFRDIMKWIEKRT
jgi:acylglycerol lipase